MNDVKPFLLSKTIWGAIIAMVGAVMNSMGFETSALSGLDGEIVTLIGGALAIYGRVRAVDKLK
jgi:hypothetical protein